MQERLEPECKKYYYQRLRVESLPTGGSSSTVAHPNAGVADGHDHHRNHQRGEWYAAQEAQQGALAMQHAAHLDASLRPPPPPPLLPTVPAHPSSGGAEAANHFATAAQQGLASHPAAYHHQQQQLTHQGYGSYGYVDDRSYSMSYHQGVGSMPWSNDGGVVPANAMREALSTTISINEQIPGHHTGMKLLLEAPPLLENGFNAKLVVSCLKGGSQMRKAQTFICRNGMASTIGREFGELLRNTHAFQHQNGEDMEISHTSSNTWGQHHQQQWDWWQGQGDQMGHAAVGTYGTSVGHAAQHALGHSVLATQGDGGMYPPAI